MCLSCALNPGNHADQDQHHTGADIQHLFVHFVGKLDRANCTDGAGNCDNNSRDRFKLCIARWLTAPVRATSVMTRLLVPTASLVSIPISIVKTISIRTPPSLPIKPHSAPIRKPSTKAIVAFFFAFALSAADRLASFFGRQEEIYRHNQISDDHHIADAVLGNYAEQITQPATDNCSGKGR